MTRGDYVALRLLHEEQAARAQARKYIESKQYEKDEFNKMMRRRL